MGTDTLELGKVYTYGGRTLRLVVEIRPDGTVLGSRWIKTTKRFSGQLYPMAGPGFFGPALTWTLANDPREAA